MTKIIQGKVIANKMNNTVVVEVNRLVAHPLYRKLMKKRKKFKVETYGQTLEIGQTVKITETKPISKDKHFALVEPKKQTNKEPEIKKTARRQKEGVKSKK